MLCIDSSKITGIVDESGNPVEQNEYELNKRMGKACFGNDIETVRSLLNEDYSYSSMMFSIVAERNYTEILILFLENKNKFNDFNGDMLSFPFSLACRMGHIETIDILSSDSDFNPNDLFDEAISSALCNGHPEIFDKLIDIGIPFNERTLISASEYNYYDIVVKLLRMNCPTYYGALSFACKNNSISIARELINANCDMQSDMIMSAANNKNQKLVILLLRAECPISNYVFESLERNHMFDDYLVSVQIGELMLSCPFDRYLSDGLQDKIMEKMSDVLDNRMTLLFDNHYLNMDLFLSKIDIVTMNMHCNKSLFLDDIKNFHF